MLLPGDARLLGPGEQRSALRGLVLLPEAAEQLSSLLGAVPLQAQQHQGTGDHLSLIHIFGLYHLQDLGRTRRVMEGEGEFVGADAYSQFGQLANVFYDSGPGLLVHPLWQTASAYFVALRLEQEPRPDYVRYSCLLYTSVHLL